MKAITWLLVFCGFALCTPCVSAADPGSAYKAGVATKVITPEKPLWMAGYASRNKPAEGKLIDLQAKAICLEDAAGKRLVLVTVELIGIPRSLSLEIAAEVEKQFGIKRADLMLAASHTHCGPVLRENLTDMYPLTQEEMDKLGVYTKKLKTDLIELVGAAIKNLEPATLKYAQGKASFAMNRREQTDKGIIIGKNPAGPVDHSVPVLAVEGKDGKPRAIVFGYACHNTTLQIYQWCGDYAGYAQLGIEKAYPGAVAMFWTGCGADANPNPRGTVEMCQQHGKELAEAVVAVVKGEMKPIAGAFAAKYETVTLKLESVPTKAQLNADLLSKTLAVQKRAERLLKELEATGKIADTYPHYPVQTWLLGDQILWVALGGEVVQDYALRLKKELPTTRTLWVAGYANDVMAYIPSARVLKEGGYEADFSQVYYGMPGKWSPMIEDIIVTKVKQLVGTTADLPKAPGPLTPKEERATFKLPDGFKIELVASEPNIIDPVAMCFDERGRLFVCEMRGYPNGGVGTGNESRGRIKCLICDDEGYFGTSQIYAEGLRFPMGLQPYKGGLLVAVAPDLIYLQDKNGTGKATSSTVLYTGFNLANIQQMVNSLQWGLDNWIYGCAGNDGGTVKSAEKPDAAAVSLRNRAFRFRAGIPASMEPTSSGGQYGMVPDDYQHWFTATNSQHLRQIVLPDHYLRRNPYLPVSAVTIDIPEHGPAARVFRISPFEPWRIERTTRRAGGPDAARFPTTELVPGGYFTSACSPLIYTANLFPPEFHGNNFVCDPANNIVHRELLSENGAVFTAKRAYEEREFLASTDTWFRPVHLTIGPDGAIYVLDFYREVIETPLSLPDDIKKQLNLESRERGRIWRISPNGFKPGKMPDFTTYSTVQLVAELTSLNPWRRNTAQRLIVERQDKLAVPNIRELISLTKGKPGRVHLLWTLEGLGELKAEDILPAFDDREHGIRENALRLAEPFYANSRELVVRASNLVFDPSSRVRFQLAFSAGFFPVSERSDILALLLVKDAADPWISTAALSSSDSVRFKLIEWLRGGRTKANPTVLTRLASMVGASGKREDITQLLTLIAVGDTKTTGEDAALLDGLGQGMRNSTMPLPAWWTKPPMNAADALAKLRKRFEAAATQLNSEKNSSNEKISAAALLAFGPFDLVGPALVEALTPSVSSDVQLAAVKALAAHTDAKVAEYLLKNWKGYGPSLRVAVLDVMLSRPERVLALLDAIEQKQLSPAELSTVQLQQIKSHPNSTVKAKAETVLKQAIDSDRAKVVAAFKPSLELKGDPALGKAVFKKHCSACHKLDGVGNDVGPNLLATIGGKSGEDLLVAVFDPNREVDPRYVGYVVGTADGKTLTGIIVTETPNSVVIRMSEGAEEVILRANLEFFRSTSLSLMPVGFEKELKHQEVADLFAYLRTAGK
jgi:putative membrane-bound dehydrogenase-like protein